MSRRLLVVLLALLMVVGLCAAWVALAPQSPFARPAAPGDSGPDRKAASRADAAPDANEDAAPDAPHAVEGHSDTPGGKAAQPQPEILRPDPRVLEATIAAQEAERQAKASGRNPAANAPAPPPAGPNALEAERQRRINALKSIKRPPNQTLGNARPRTRKTGEVGKKDLPEKLRQDRRGLYAKYYAFASNPISELLDPTKPLLEARTPDVTRIDQQVSFQSKEAWSDITFDKGNFVATWEGFLVVEKEADCWLYLGADLHGNVQLDGEFVLIDDMVDYTEVSTVLTLSAGLHPIKIQYLEARNGSPVQNLGSCNFMYVPAGQSRPIPVPPEMLLLPEALWSDNAPIITRLSKNSGEIGDEITIYGQNLGDEPPTGTTSGIFGVSFRVTFAGADALCTNYSPTALTVRVPIGAVSGRVIVHRVVSLPLVTEGSSGPALSPEWTPSNSVDFAVITQFGLYASWHNMQGQSNVDYVDPGSREPDLVRLEREFMFESRDKLTIPFRNSPLAGRWEGKLGIPSSWAQDGRRLVRFSGAGRLRVTLGTETKATDAAPGDGGAQTTIDFEVPAGEERYLPLTIEWTNQSGAASLRVAEMKASASPIVSDMPNIGDLFKGWIEVRVLPTHLFFPPVVPPQPPKIISVKPLWPEGEQAPALPYAAGGLPGVREGQSFEFEMEIYGKAEVRSQPVSVSVDGRPVAFEVIAVAAVNATTERQVCKGKLPTGCGEGVMTARMAVVTSDPFMIDVTNKGLIAYLYDLPNPGGYTKMPELEPMTCFAIRKDAQVNFENANEFKLPFPAETFAVEWYGALIVEREGDYIFTCRSDDGIYVWLDNNLVLVDDNLHYQREKSSEKVHLAAGVHTFRMTFFENNVHEVSVLYWQAADAQGQFLPKQVIPKRNYTWDDHPPLPTKPATGKRADGSDPQ